MTRIDRASRKILRYAQSLFPKSPGGTQILLYHLIDGGTGTPVDIDLQQFRSHLEYLKNANCLRSLSETIAALQSDSEIQKTIVSITFDDAYENFYTTVWPLIEELKVPVTLYVPTHFVDSGSPFALRGCEPVRVCTWKQLQEMANDGLVTIGSHSVNHIDLRKAGPETVEREVSESKKRLEDRLGVAVTSFAYPKALWSSTAETYVSKHYSSAVIAGGTRMQPRKWNRFRLSRIPIRRDMYASLDEVLQSRVWLEERIASFLRTWVRS